jgi:RNA polymerase sigma-70 factor (ECF subfamily)
VPRPVSDEYARAYGRWWMPVYRSALAWTNEPATAEDLAQEAFVRLWQRREAIDWDGPVLGWLLVTVRRLGTDRVRRFRRAIRLRVHEIRPAGWDEEMWVEWLDLRRSMAQLRPVERIAIVLTFVEGLTSAEVGPAIGVSPAAVRAIVSRARSKLEAAR